MYTLSRTCILLFYKRHSPVSGDHNISIELLCLCLVQPNAAQIKAELYVNFLNSFLRYLTCICDVEF